MLGKSEFPLGSLLSIMSFLRLPLCRLMTPLKMASIRTAEVVINLESCRKKTSKVFGARASLMKLMSEVEAVLVWIFLRFRL